MILLKIKNKKNIYFTVFSLKYLKKKMNSSGFAMTFYYTVLVILISTNFSHGNDGKYICALILFKLIF